MVKKKKLNNLKTNDSPMTKLGGLQTEPHTYVAYFMRSRSPYRVKVNSQKYDVFDDIVIFGNFLAIICQIWDPSQFPQSLVPTGINKKHAENNSIVLKNLGNNCAATVTNFCQFEPNFREASHAV